MNAYTMNRLIILGNGFDLAHGMSTGYNDFIVWLLKRALEGANYVEGYSDEAMIVHHLNFAYTVAGFKTASHLVDFAYSKQNLSFFFTRGGRLSLSDIQYLENPYIIVAKNEFVCNLIKKYSNCNWVDIENQYYRELKAITKDPYNQDQRIENLNAGLSYLITALEKYLSKQEYKKGNEAYSAILRAPIKNDELLEQEGFSEQKEIKPERSLILNFNYTSTVEQYLKSEEPTADPHFEVSYIHGKLQDTENPIIFGFGDELDNDYAHLEQNESKGLLDYIKSFWYFKTSNYHDLVRFIDSSDYQVFILGHSCGLSDRTMLNMIFEHPRCKSIKLFYHQGEKGNNFRTLTQEVSRHFKDKGSMRKKIVPFDKSSAMPQASK
ncbi:AbiH family protein [Pedobacter sp.]|uniref:AbiH family protein n=1 Tax=Pedobacter sp. TaxID=1411316 RepID=UPI003BAAF7C0